MRLFCRFHHGFLLFFLLVSFSDYRGFGLGLAWTGPSLDWTVWYHRIPLWLEEPSHHKRSIGFAYLNSYHLQTVNRFPTVMFAR